MVTETCRAQFILTSWAIGSVCFRLCATETTEEFKGGKWHDLVCLLERTPSCHAENGLQVTRVKEKKPVMDLFQNSNQGMGLAVQKWVDQEIFGSNFKELISERTVEREKGPALISKGLQPVAGRWRRQISRGAWEDVAAEVNTREGG